MIASIFCFTGSIYLIWFILHTIGWVCTKILKFTDKSILHNQDHMDSDEITEKVKKQYE